MERFKNDNLRQLQRPFFMWFSCVLLLSFLVFSTAAACLKQMSSQLNFSYLCYCIFWWQHKQNAIYCALWMWRFLICIFHFFKVNFSRNYFCCLKVNHKNKEQDKYQQKQKKQNGSSINENQLDWFPLKMSKAILLNNTVKIFEYGSIIKNTPLRNLSLHIPLNLESIV